MVDKKNFAETQDDLTARLRGGLILYKKLPYYVVSCPSATKVNIIPCEYVLADAITQGNHSLVVKLDDDDLDINPFKLGYVSYDTDAFFLVRVPARSRRHSLGDNNITWLGVVDRGFGSRAFFSESFKDMVTNKYPTLEQAIELVRDGRWRSHAFSRTLAVKRAGRKLVLMHRGEEVAYRPDNAINGSWIMFDKSEIPSYLLSTGLSHGVEFAL